jgi:hypothetical protein
MVKTKQIFRLLLSFILTVFLVTLTLFVTAKFTLFSSSYIKHVSNSTHYSKMLTKEINTDIQEFSLGSNVPKEVTNSIVSEARVNKDVNNYFAKIYTPNGKYKMSDGELKTEITNKIKQYATDNRKQIASEEDLNALVNKMAGIYTDYVNLPYIQKAGALLVSMQKYLLLGIGVSLVMVVLIAFILLKSLRGYAHRLFRYLSYALISSGIMIVLVPLILLIKETMSHFYLKSEAMYHLFKGYFNGILLAFSISGGILLVVGIVLAVVSEKKRKMLMR